VIPVSVLTGFLGSGKTTLLARLLRSPQFSRTAVIINEFGEVGLDHDLVETSDESFVELQTGCLCCKLRSDLVETLSEILARRDAGTVPAFERVVIETSGLADPAPILHALMDDAGLSERLRLADVVTVVDAVNGFDTIARQPEAVKQIALADRLVLSKTDLTGAVGVVPEDLRARLRAFNRDARVMTACNGMVEGGEDVIGAGTAARPWAKIDSLPSADAHGHAHHAEDVSYVALVRDKPVPAVALTLFLECVAEHCGADLLRLKGIVDIAESPGRPAVIHGVQHVFHAPAWLERWPSEDRRTRMVLIGRNLSQAWLERLMEAIEAEVEEVGRLVPRASRPAG
jgi:G3E family GTPase